MNQERVQRRLAAILAADVVGYSRLMEADETGTLAALKAVRADLVDPTLAHYSGRIVKTTGDGLLVEFPSVVDAVASAVTIQREMLARNAKVPEARQIRFRVGINLGDIIIDGDDIYGDGVNVAARLEGLASPGSICLSGQVYDQVHNKLDAKFEDLGEQSVKNIARPVRVFEIQCDQAGQKQNPFKKAPTKKNKPSLAVLPFDNMSAEPEQSYFSDGITEDIITELSRFPDLFVIARNSTFAFKGKNKKIDEIANELNVDYVVEGSVRKAGNRVRVTAQLIDAATQAHLWANRYDREITDIFDIQDEIASTVAATVSGRAEAAFAQRVFNKPPQNMAAHEFVLAAKVLHHRGARSDNAEAQRLIDRAIEADPNFAVAHAWKCCILGQAWERGFGEFDKLFPIALTALEKAIALDPNDIEANRVSCEAFMDERKLDDARRHNDLAYRKNPNDPRIVAQRGELLTWSGQAKEGSEWIRAAMRLDPFESHARAHLLGRALYLMGSFREAADAYAANPQPRSGRRAEYAAALAMAGELTEAGKQAAEVLRANPSFKAANYAQSLPFARLEDREALTEGLKRAGFD